MSLRDDIIATLEVEEEFGAGGELRSLVLQERVRVMQRGWWGRLNVAAHFYGTVRAMVDEGLLERSVPRDGIEPPTRGFSIRPSPRENSMKEARTARMLRAV